ncbi:spore germination protein [Paenibacillus sp. R14(2021)]|uniref:spore germination protein n=1 Tax=Paenibacillus sp. R14(2021) TaxID=2859228 RepID=UPI001C613F07|nr:spore germination protein [Paenibacillus sp. R14(2021)]
MTLVNQTDLSVKKSMSENINDLQQLFYDCPDLIYKHYSERNTNACLVFFVGLIKEERITFHMLEHLLKHVERMDANLIELEENAIITVPVSETREMTEIVSSILEGSAILFIDKLDKALVIKAQGGLFRDITEPKNESALRGSKEGFIENCSANIALLRQKIHSPQLKIAYKELGENTKTKVGVVYLGHVVKQDLLLEVHRRLDRIKINGVLESEYIEEMIEDHPNSLFPQIQNTERPDKVAGNLLEGRIAIICDGSPSVLIVPSTFWQMMQSSEDYYNRYYFSIFQRAVRYFSVLVSFLLPALYVAISTYHIEMIPTKFLLTFMASRDKIPFPAVLEAFMMELLAEILREAGLRLPKAAGQTISILGAIVIGTATVEAGIVSAPMVIIVSFTGICGSTIPLNNIANSFRLLRFPLIILAGIFGLFGITIGLAFVAAHLCSMQSFGTPFLSPVAPLSLTGLKDTLVRLHWSKLKNPRGHANSGWMQSLLIKYVRSQGRK